MLTWSEAQPDVNENGRRKIDFSVRIRDHGIGLEAGDLEKIFGAFTQVEDAARLSRWQGSGVGLEISRQYVLVLKFWFLDNCSSLLVS